jgi:hypothetical protein
MRTWAGRTSSVRCGSHGCETAGKNDNDKARLLLRRHAPRDGCGFPVP